MTEQEIKLWNILRNSLFYGLKFRRQVPIGKYVVEFLSEQRELRNSGEGTNYMNKCKVMLCQIISEIDKILLRPV